MAKMAIDESHNFRCRSGISLNHARSQDIDMRRSPEKVFIARFGCIILQDSPFQVRNGVGIPSYTSNLKGRQLSIPGSL